MGKENKIQGDACSRKSGVSDAGGGVESAIN